MTRQTLRPYQQVTLDWLLNWTRWTAPGGRVLVVAPTGTGKGTAQLALVARLRADGLRPLILTPSLEVLRGYVERSGGDPNAGTERLVAQAAEIPATTPLRWRNAVLRGDAGDPPDVVLVDEAHHALDAEGTVSGDVFTLAQHARWVGWTATPWRGTPQGTQALTAAWPEAVAMLTLPQAARLGAMTLPRFFVRPVLDDDLIQVKGGEFDPAAADAAVKASIGDLAELVARSVSDGLRPLPTVVTVPGVGAAEALRDALAARSLDARLVVGGTPSGERVASYEACRSAGAILVAVAVLGEGVDLPWLRRWIDAAPTTSPVRWLQRLGRITRPGPRGEYVGTNRNLERHGYLLEGALPATELRHALAEGLPLSPRVALGRSLGLDVLGRRKATKVPLAGGGHAYLFGLAHVDADTGRVAELATILDPSRPEPIVAARGYDRAADPKSRPKWVRLTGLPDALEGYTRASASVPLSGPMETWWRASYGARAYGLDGDAEIDRRAFQALPILRDLGLKVGGEAAGAAREVVG